MPLTFKKVQSGANRFFKKIDQGANKFFKKTIPDVAKKAGGALEDFGGDVARGATKVGNFLEKNAGVISDAVGGALMATGYGAPLAGAVMAAGNSAQQFGGKLKQGGQVAQRDINKVAQLTQSKATDLANRGLQLTGKATGQATNLVNQGLAQAQTQGNQLLAKVV
jgi:hypothetical protein